MFDNLIIAQKKNLSIVQIPTSKFSILVKAQNRKRALIKRGSANHSIRCYRVDI